MHNLELFFTLASLFAQIKASGQHHRFRTDLAPLEPWQVMKLSTFSPSGRPGNSPLAHLWANITSPGSVPAGSGVSFDQSSANCTVDWVWGDEKPYSLIYECATTVTATAEADSSRSSSKWTIEILEADSGYFSPTENIAVKFTLTNNLTIDGDEFYKVLVGIQHFEVGENMRGSCGGSGVCSWELREEDNPVLVQPTVVACEGDC
ncbi:hypothetical protein F4779DRAFT_369665 [Xylariaceae sp. FL0662B]|nr:hypothetical protein F4779DRAFT_369665 [Xylariaceae sp. FL0662B]